MRLFLFIILFAGSTSLNATHIMGGEFRYSHLSGSTYSIIFHFYTDLISPVDRPELIFDFGDGTLDTIPRTTIEDFPIGSICSSIRFATYVTQHTYPGPGTYIITLIDPNRNVGISNIPDSGAEPFCVSASLMTSLEVAGNNSVIFQNPQYLIVQNGWSLQHLLDPFDVDGDSLSFEPVVPSGTDCDPIAGYTFPGPIFSVDPGTGEWSFTADALGEYVIAVRAKEWRDGQIIGEVTRDMTICIMTTGLQEMEHPRFSLSPTLTNGSISVNSSSDRKAQIRILSANGSLVMEDVFNGRSHSLDLGSLENGLYLVQLREPDGPTTSVRVVKH
jgi:hypothetical protein